MPRNLDVKDYPLCATIGALLAVTALAAYSTDVLARDESRDGASHNMRLVGHDDLQARSAYQPIIQKQGRFWIAYVGHHNGEALNPLTGQVEVNGVSIVDVTSPRRPVYLHHLPAVGGSQMVQTCSGDELPGGTAGTVYLLRTNGNDGHEIWDVTNPAEPEFVVTVLEGLEATHKNWWECETGIAYLVADLRPEGWRTNRGLKVFDLSTPETPMFIRNFAIPELAPDTPEPEEPFPGQNGIHEATSSFEVGGDRVYLGYGTGRNGVLQVLDRTKLLEGDPEVAEGERFTDTEANLLFPQIARLDLPLFWGAHTVWPLLDVEVPEFEPFLEGTPRDFLVVTNESTSNRCQENMHQMVFFVDITDEAHPWPVSNYHVEEDEGLFCDVGGRFGAHSQNWSFTPTFYRKITFHSYFNAGIRAIDVRNPFHPKEVAFFIPETTENTDERCAEIDGVEECDVAIQTNNVEVDDRGLIYAADRANTGLHIVELTGDAKKVADLKGKKLDDLKKKLTDRKK